MSWCLTNRRIVVTAAIGLSAAQQLTLTLVYHCLYTETTQPFWTRVDNRGQQMTPNVLNADTPTVDVRPISHSRCSAAQLLLCTRIHGKYFLFVNCKGAFICNSSHLTGPHFIRSEPNRCDPVLPSRPNEMRWRMTSTVVAWCSPSTHLVTGWNWVATVRFRLEMKWGPMGWDELHMNAPNCNIQCIGLCVNPP